jgi:hypothetical protein
LQRLTEDESTFQQGKTLDDILAAEIKLKDHQKQSLLFPSLLDDDESEVADEKNYYTAAQIVFIKNPVRIPAKYLLKCFAPYRSFIASLVIVKEENIFPKQMRCLRIK